MLCVAIVFDNTLRPETTGTYCLRALEELAREGRITSVEHLFPSQLVQSDCHRFDLCVFIDDGLEDDFPQLNIPTAWWAIDTHLAFERCLKKARQADVTFAAQRNGVEQLRAAGIAHVHWLPLACDPEIHGRRNVHNQWDVAFVGNFFPGARTELLQLVHEKFPRSCLGQADYRQLGEIYSSAKIVFNRSLRDDINMRVFEGLCSGALVITNDLAGNGQNELFTPGEHLVTYRSAGELLEKVDYYLANDFAREQIAAAGREQVLREHTYRHRMEEVLQHLCASPQLTSAPDCSAASGTVPVCAVDGPAKKSAVRECVNGSRPHGTHPLKSTTYYEFDRPDVLELVPRPAQRVLDIGCGGGKLGAAIKSRQSAHVTGIELNPAAIDAACQRLDEVVIGDVQAGGIEFPAENFDCVICADVLEHLRDPLTVLRKVRRWLAPEGTLVTSIPNVRHHTVLRSLLAGNWTYESAGLLDEDHVRFFTRREIEKLLFRAGFAIQQQRMVGDEAYRTWQQQGSPRQVQLGPFQLHAASAEEAAELFAYQYLTTAAPAPERSFGLTSIVLVTFNQWPHTKACLDSIRLLTDEPYELIVVDNGSTDGTVEFLRADPQIRLLENGRNRGFPAAANQGILASQGQQVLLLNNDTVVTTGWLERLLTACNSHAAIGLAGPVTNHISGEQQVSVSYEDLTQLDGFAWDWGKQHHRRVQPTDRLVGFCLLIKKEVIDRIGLLDEQFGIGNFEDDDYCRRAIAAGYQCVIARDAFIHHVGSATFRNSGVNFGRLLQENQRKYQEKWRGTGERGRGSGDGREEHRESHGQVDGEGMTDPLRGLRASVFPHSSPAGEESLRGSSCRPEFLLEMNDEGDLLLKPNGIQLSASLIVRDNEQTIRPCLESLLPWMDEVVVVDTGSLDRTPQICEELGARVLHSPWQDSFSQARNVSLSYARGDWIFWMDSDDTLPETCGRKLRELACGDHLDAVLGYIIQVHCPGETPDDITVVDHVKLLRNRPDLRFEFHIHEQILPAIRRAGGEVAWTDLYVVHSGSDKTPEGRVRKLTRDFKLLALDLADHPDHPFVLFNLGMTCADAGQHQEAVQYLTRCVQVSSPQESHLRKAYALLIGSLMQLGKTEAALDVLTKSLRLFPEDKELLFRQAMLFHQQGQLRDAEQTYLRILQEQTTRHFTSMDAGLTDHKARHNLAIVYEDLDEHELARQVWTDILHVRPNYEPARQALRQLDERLQQESSARPDFNF